MEGVKKYGIRSYSAPRRIPKQSVIGGVTVTGASSNSSSLESVKSSVGRSSNNGSAVPSAKSANNAQTKDLKLPVNGEHCIFCLRKVNSQKYNESPIIDDEASNHLMIVPKAVVVESVFLGSFNRVWPYIQRKSGSSQEVSLDDVVGGGSQKASSGTVGPPGKAVTFPKLPTLCQFCADKVKQVETLMEAVRTEIKKIQSVILDSKKGGQFSWRAEQLEKDLKNASGVVTAGGNKSTTIRKAGASSLNQVTATKPPTVLKRLSSVPLTTSSAPAKQPKVVDQILPQVPEKQAVNSTQKDSPDVKEEDEISNVETESGNEEDSDSDYIKSEMDSDDETDSEEDQMSCEDEDEILTHSVETDNTEKNEEKDPLGDVASTSAKPYTPIYKTMCREDSGNDTSWMEFYVCNKPIKCTVKGCIRAYDTDEQLTNHMKRSHRELLDTPFQCKCGESFLTKESRRNHLKTSVKHAGETLVKTRGETQMCDMCGETVLFRDILEHLRSHVGDYLITCPNPSCKYTYSNSFALGNHLRIFKQCSKIALGGKGKKEYSCEICDYTTTKRLCLRGHLKQFHERAEKNFACPIPNCDERFATRQSVDFHLSTHSLRSVSEQKCKPCSKTFPIEDMTAHLKDEHKAEEIFKCQHCPFLFFERLSLIEHLYAHRHQGLFCDMCSDSSVKYLRHSELCEHYGSVHKLECRKYPCTKCSKVFGYKEGLEGHMRTKHTFGRRSKSTNPKNFKCDDCLGSVAYTTLKALISHKIRVHGDDPFKCKTCDQTFHSSHELNRHEKGHAGLNVEYKCEEENCGKVFASNKSLKYHLTHFHHQGEQTRHECDECGRSYNTEAGLRTHRDTVHLKLKQVVCDVCGETFINSQTLKHHSLVHTGERPYQCTICGQRFRQNVVLARHLKSHEEKGASFKPNGPMKHIRKRVERKL